MNIRTHYNIINIYYKFVLIVTAFLKYNILKNADPFSFKLPKHDHFHTKKFNSDPVFIRK